MRGSLLWQLGRLYIFEGAVTQSILFYTIGDFKGSGGTAPHPYPIENK